MRRSLTRAASGVAVAAAAVLALAGPASAATAHPRVHTTLSIVEAKNVIKAGHTDVVSGRLAADRIGLKGHLVYLDRWNGIKFVELRVKLTGANGGVSFVVQPGVTARYELVYRGNADFAPTHSGVVTVKVTP
jgi:hypothetical protein